MWIIRGPGGKAAEDGATEVGYIFILVITALILTSMTMLTATIIHDATQNAISTQLQQVDKTLKSELEECVYFALTYPTCHYSKNVTLPKTLDGDPYTVALSGSYYYVNTSAGDVKLKTRLEAPGIELAGQITSNSGMIRMVYKGNGVVRIE